MLDEFFREAFRKKFYSSLPLTELQADLDAWLHHYNYERPHRGCRNQGRRPYETFSAGKKDIGKKLDKADRKEVKKAA